MSYMDLMSRYLKVQSPLTQSFWSRLRLLFAGLIYPEFKKRHDDWCSNYFTQNYMLAVHKHYESQTKTLNKALVRKDNQIKQLQARLKEYEP